MNHGSIVCWAAHQTSWDGYKNHGAFVSHWAHQAKSASDLAVLGAMAARYARIGAGKICTVVAPTNCH